MRDGITFISWAPYCSRSDSIAARLGGTSHMVYAARWGSRPATILLKYASQTLTTFRILLSERPKAIFVMMPPVVAAIPVLFYAKLFGTRVFLDSHTAAFLGSAWSRVLFLHRWASRRATATIVTGEHLRDIVASWNAPVQLVSDVPVVFAEPEPFEVAPGFNIAVISSFNRDEPTRELVEAAGRVPEVTFYITGNTKKLAPEIMSSRPANVHFTGFLSDGRYAGLLKACDAVAALTTRDHTMQRGAYEAIYLQKPVLTSNFPILRSSFPKGTVHVDATVDAIVDGVRDLKKNLLRYRSEAEELCEAKRQRWQETAKRLRELAGLSETTEGDREASSVDLRTPAGACSK